MFVKVKFLKSDRPSGAAYTYDAGDIPVVVGDRVELPNGALGVVVEIDVPEKEVAAFRDKIKMIVRKREKDTLETLKHIKTLLGDKGEILLRNDCDSGLWFIHCTMKKVLSEKHSAANFVSLYKEYVSDLSNALEEVLKILDNKEELKLCQEE